MKKNYLLSLLCLCFQTGAFSQGWSFEYHFGYGKYQLDDVKTIQNSLQQHMKQYNARNTEVFPDWFTHTATIGYIVNRNHFGINFSYLTTGGRTGVTDYSGAYYADITMNGYRFGTFYRYYIKTGLLPLDLYVQVSPGMLFTELEMDEYINIGTVNDSSNEKMKSTAAYFEPSFGVMYHITKWLSFSVSGGYEADIWGKLKNNGNKSDLKAHWNGLRFYAGIGLVLPSGQ